MLLAELALTTAVFPLSWVFKATAWLWKGSKRKEFLAWYTREENSFRALGADGRLFYLRSSREKTVSLLVFSNSPLDVLTGILSREARARGLGARSPQYHSARRSRSILLL